MSPRRPLVRDMLIHIDGDARTALGRQVEEQLRKAIRGGSLGAGEQLPSTRMLAQDLGISRGVVGRAYAQLAAEGYLLVKQGSNPCVSPHFSTRRLTPPLSREPERRRWRFDLRPEHPDLSQLPRREWSRSLQWALDCASDRDLGHVDQCGLPQLREEIAGYIARVRGAVVDPEHLVTTACSTHSLLLIARALVRQGHTTLAFENPSRAHQHHLVRRTGLEPVGLPVDENGLVVDELESCDVRCVVVSPAHQFPLGVELAQERRMQLLEWAERRDCIVVEDDNDAEFCYDRPPAGCLQALAPHRVVYLGSASKALSPGFGLGWAVLPSRLLEPVSEELWASTLHPPSLEHLAFADFLARGEFDRHIRRMRATYRRRRDVAIDALRTELPRLRVRGVAAGLHLTLELTGEREEEAALRSAIAAGINLEAITPHALPGYVGPRGLLMGFGAIPEPTVSHAISALAIALGTDRDQDGDADRVSNAASNL